MTWNWLRNSWTEITGYFGTNVGSTIGRIVGYATGDFNTPFELKELEQFYEDHKNELGTAKRSTLNQIENVRANVKWMENYYQEITDWLKDNVENDFSVSK